MDLGLTGKVAAVAAASKGLGRACAEALAAEGADIAICARDKASLGEAVAALAATGVRVHAFACDLTEPDACEQFVRTTLDTLGRIDVLVANNGGPKLGGTQDVTLEDYRQGLEQNLLVTVRLVREALPQMRERGWGRIIAITSSSAKQPIEGLALSNTARAGATAFLKTLASEVAREGITVNAVAPGTFLTDRLRFLVNNAAEQGGISFEQALAGFGGGSPIGRVGRPEEFGAVVAFLASEQASYLTGTTIGIDGGVGRTTF